MSDILNNTITTDTEKSFADAVQEWLGQHKDAVFGVAAAMAGAGMANAANEVKKNMYDGNTSSLLGLRRQAEASNKMCTLKVGSTLLTKGLSVLAIADAFSTDMENKTPDQSLKTAASLTIAYGLGGILTTAVGAGVLGTALVAATGAAIYIYIDNNWEGIKREGLSYIWNDYVDGISNIIYDAMINLDDDTKNFMNEKVGQMQTTLNQNKPDSIDSLYNDMASNNPDNLDGLRNLLGRNFCPLENNPIKNITTLISTAEVTRSPLVVDLDGDGVETTTKYNGVYFDHDGNGFAEKTGWADRDDGVLVRDINGNGEIEDGTELFGNNSVLASGQKAANGFEALKDLDNNDDGVFNSSDTAWNSVKVWKDANQNGFVEEGEILTLEQANIKSINLGYTNSDTIDANGNTHGQNSTITKNDGTSGNISDIWFDVDLTNTADRSDVTIPDAIKALPNVEGFGNVHNLQTAMALDTSGELKTLVEQYVTETSPTVHHQLDSSNRDF